MSGRESKDFGSKDAGEKSSDWFEQDGKDASEPLVVDVTSIRVSPVTGGVADGFDLAIQFSLDRDVVAGYWIIKFLVDLTNNRLIKILGETSVEDYLEGENDLLFKAKSIDLSGVMPSTLANSALLMACFIADGEEVLSVNVVVNVKKENGVLIREFLNPM